MSPSRHIAAPAYMVSIMLIVIPLGDAWLAIVPMHLERAQRRYGAVGIMSNAAMIPMSGFLIAFATARAMNQVRFLRFLGLISALGVLLTISALTLFILDALQGSASVPPELRLSFKVATPFAIGKLLLSLGAFAAFAAGGLRGGTPIGESGPAAEPRLSGGLIVPTRE